MCAIVRNRSQIRNARKGAPLKFALFYEIPVARPWTPDSEHIAYQNTLEQAIFGDEMGFHAFWTVEHHFLEAQLP